MGAGFVGRLRPTVPGSEQRGDVDPVVIGQAVLAHGARLRTRRDSRTTWTDEALVAFRSWTAAYDEFCVAVAVIERVDGDEFAVFVHGHPGGSEYLVERGGCGVHSVDLPFEGIRDCYDWGVLVEGVE
jgi:hypothetical protein